MVYLLLALSVFFAVCNNALLHKYNDGTEKCGVFAFNSCVSLLWAAILLLGGFNSLSLDTLLYGILYGSMIAVFLLFKTLALGSGPVSLTSLIGCCSLIIPTLSGAVIWKERIDLFQIAGLFALFAGLFLCVDPKSDVKITKKWIILCLLFFLAAGANGLTMKIFNKSGNTAEVNEMMIIASLVSFALFAIISLVVGLSRRAKKMPFLTVTGKKAAIRSGVYILLCGLVSCGYQRLNLYLSGALPGIIFFPVFNGSVIFLSCVAGVFLFREKLSKKQIAGLALGLIAIILINGTFSFLLG